MQEAGITNFGRDMLQSAASWSRFLAIVGFIGCGLMVILGLVMIALADTIERRSYGQPEVPVVVTSISYCISALIYFFPALHLNNFASRTLNALMANNQSGLESGFESLRNMFRLIGIYTIVGIGLLILAVFVFVAALGTR